MCVALFPGRQSTSSCPTTSYFDTHKKGPSFCTYNVLCYCLHRREFGGDAIVVHITWYVPIMSVPTLKMYRCLSLLHRTHAHDRSRLPILATTPSNTRIGMAPSLSLDQTGTGRGWLGWRFTFLLHPAFRRHKNGLMGRGWHGNDPAPNTIESVTSRHE